MTISGSNLGVTVNDVSVLIGTIECTLLKAKYKPGKCIDHAIEMLVSILIQLTTKGKEIVCITKRASSEGERTITVRIRRAQTELTSSYNSFNYALPHVSLVHPRYGPVSGGTLVTISGGALDVGNTKMITVKIADEICEIT